MKYADNATNAEGSPESVETLEEKSSEISFSLHFFSQNSINISAQWW